LPQVKQRSSVRAKIKNEKKNEKRDEKNNKKQIRIVLDFLYESGGKNPSKASTI
jgi:hypothetical protein